MAKGVDEVLRSNSEELIRKNMASFVDRELIPKAQEFDERGEVPREMFLELGRMGVFGIRYLKNKGGSERKQTLFCIINEELARGLMGLAATVGMQGLMGTEFLFRFGTREMHEKYFLPAVRGEKIACFCLTEPDAGSDLGSVSTSARKTSDGYVVNGLKTWVTNGPVADFYTVLCQTDSDKKFRGLNFFFVPRETPGVSHGNPFSIIGTRTSKISEVYFNDCYIPDEYQLGAEGEGFPNLLNILASIRCLAGSQAIGLQRAALDDAIRYARQREQFGHTLSKYQLIQAKIADMAVDLEASKHLVYHAAHLIDKEIECLKEASIAKYFATEAACRSGDEITRIFGAYGFSMEYTAQRYYRDSRFLISGAGTAEILKTNIAKWMGV